ncbi:hypothetical protein [Streptomyces sp. NPDC002671]
MGMAPPMQYRVVSLAGPGGQPASSLPASVISIPVARAATFLKPPVIVDATEPAAATV